MTTPPESPVPHDPIARRFEGKVAFITGAARGQGRAHAVRLAAEGADVIAVDIAAQVPETKYEGATPEDLAETVRQVEALGRRIVATRTDIRDYDALKAALDAGVGELGRLDVVIANAGTTTAAKAWEMSAAQWAEQIDTNLNGPFHTAKAAIPTMIEQGTGGAIVFISSVAGLRGLPYLAGYVAAKHGVTGLAKTLANELAEHRIRVNTVHPHGVQTGLTVPELFPMISDASPTLSTLYMGQLPDQVSQSDDIAAAVAWLASNEARHVTGIQLPIDLGRTNR